MIDIGHDARCPIRMRLFLLLTSGVVASAQAQIRPEAPSWLPPATAYDAPFFGNVQYDSSIKSPDQVLGYRLGTRPATHAELEKCLESWRGSKRITIQKYGETHEGRALYYVVVTSDANQARIASIRESIGKLADPRKLANTDEAQKLVKESPAIAWLAYNIHGDELSSTDAAIALIYHLIACADERGQAAYTVPVSKLLDQLVIVIDPLMNPDGRDRFINQLNEFAGHTPNLDAQAMQHGGRWPYGRGNHYFFDLNRDWMQGVQPETRGRQKAIAEWNPQLLVDSHEMEPYDTYLFNPPREPFNPQLSPLIRKWWGPFAGDQAKAFDRFGWSYYTREWLEYWYPGYTDSWGAFHGAIGMLYEQARVGGSPIRQMAGNILTYRESVHHHAISSITNLETLQSNRAAILADFLQHNRECCGLDRGIAAAGGAAAQSKPASTSKSLSAAGERSGVAGQAPSPRHHGTFLLVPGANPTRERKLLDSLSIQGIEIGVTQRPLATTQVVDVLRNTHETRTFPAGTFAVSMRQPAGRLAAAFLEFDPHMTDEFLAVERRELAAKRQSRVYDVTGWSVPLACDVDGYWSDADLDVPVQPYKPAESSPGKLEPAERAYGYVIDGADDAVQKMLATLLQSDVKLRVAQREFRLNGREFGRGSLLVRNHENDPDVAKRLAKVVEAAHVTAYAVQTGLSRDNGPDLGGSYFTLLHRPRVAIFGNAPVETTSYGNVWHLLDCELGLSISLLNLADGAGIDLRRYNVVIMPAVSGDAGEAYGGLRENLKSWVKSGGTLIAIGSAIEPLLDEKEGLSAVRLRQNVLPKLDEYEYAVRLERAATSTQVDPDDVWNNGEESSVGPPPTSAPASSPDAGEKSPAEQLDEHRRIFSPGGVIVRGELTRDHWLTLGCENKRSDDSGKAAGKPAELTTGISEDLADDGRFEMPLFFEGSNVLLAKHPIETPVRLTPRKRLRLSGLLWPEAAARMADSAYATVEREGNGQVILFACDPNFRGYYQGSRRLLVNAVLLGPGCGTSPPTPEP